MANTSVSFFLVPYVGPKQSYYQFISVALAQGFQELGVHYSANIEYWWDHESDQWLFTKGNADSTDIHVYDSKYFDKNKGAIKEVNYEKVNVLIDSNDRMFTPALDDKYKGFDLILRTHYLSAYNYRENVVPWAFGFTKETMRAIADNDRQVQLPRVMVSYRKLHDIRKMSNDRLVPRLAEKYTIFNFESEQPDETVTNDPRSLWSQTGRRYDPQYFEELDRSLLNLAFGGTPIVPPLPLSLPTRVLGKIKRTLLALRYGADKIPARYYTLVQYDSWRLWESFLSPTCPVFTNCNDLGITLPATPVAGEHYIAVDGFDFEAAAERIMQLSEKDIMKIGAQGRIWALTHYAPRPTAERLLSLIDERKNRVK